MASSDPAVSRRELANIELFRGASASTLDEARRSARRLSFAKDARIFDQGDPRVRAHALLEGSVRISQSGSDGAQIVIRFIGPGEIFGAAAAFADRRYPADADAMEPCVEVSWSETDLLRLISRHPQVAINALKIMGRRLHELQNRLREVSTQSVERRVAHTILRLVHQFGREAPHGKTIALPLRRKDIADIAGTTLYSVSRSLTSWERRGLLFTRDQTLTVVKVTDLRGIAEMIVE
ncbi:Crp/Fnr family transcriptional regulator [Bradyrhizobium monzae]|uniref:Crp/Fnr family transcriptional regulator n=1 Tax=Bradyrhizobium sp. Oc8 TaxID=2876780 RepID=UPI001F40708E|nr:Crp/Fnr family transcriptional regulator [Bradyrhizobium sp. Oc8]